MTLAAAPGRTLVKICGLTTREDVDAALEAGADALGFVFFEGSPRAVTAQTVAGIARDVPAAVAKVGVFVDTPPAERRRTALVAGLDVFQLPASAADASPGGEPLPVWRALRVGPGFRTDHALTALGEADGLLLDTLSATAPGGTGESFDWTLAAGLRERVPLFFLAGGLRPENVGDAIAAARPHGVDVSSGVEASPGRKDKAKLRAFVAAVRATAPERA